MKRRRKTFKNCVKKNKMTKGRNGNKNCRQDGGHSTLTMMHGIAMTLRWLIGHLVVTFTDSNHLKKTPDKQEGKSTSSINMRERERERNGEAIQIKKRYVNQHLGPSARYSEASHTRQSHSAVTWHCMGPRRISSRCQF